MISTHDSITKAVTDVLLGWRGSFFFFMFRIFGKNGISSCESCNTLEWWKLMSWNSDHLRPGPVAGLHVECGVGGVGGVNGVDGVQVSDGCAVFREGFV